MSASFSLGDRVQISFAHPEAYRAVQHLSHAGRRGEIIAIQPSDGAGGGLWTVRLAPTDDRPERTLVIPGVCLQPLPVQAPA